MELLLFHLGEPEIYGINVFKVREVMKRPSLVRMPESDSRVEGVANIRGQTVPVVNLRRALGLPEGQAAASNIIIAEYNQSMHGLIVVGVDRIVRISWDQVKPPPPLLQNSRGGSVTAVTLLEDGRMVLILDVEKVFSDISPKTDDDLYGTIPASPKTGKRVLFADDSQVARKQIVKTLERLGLSYISAKTGREAWECLVELATKAAAEGKTVRDELHLILSDIEMPEMDGFTLTKHVTSDPRFRGIPVIMHSSLTGSCNTERGRAMGATDYVTKFDPKVLAETIQRYC
jgi:two-component system chemotaxis response regulator CheV